MTSIKTTTVQRQEEIESTIAQTENNISNDQVKLLQLEEQLKDEQSFVFMETIFGINTKNNLVKKLEELKEELSFQTYYLKELQDNLAYEKNHGERDDDNDSVGLEDLDSI